MTLLRSKRIQSLTQYSAIIEEFVADSEGPVWYRGVGRASFTLLPTLYRHETKSTPENLAQLEVALITRFRQRSIPFHSRSLADDLETLFFMQHYGVPTRLLDWTENPLVALYFAVTGARRDTTRSGYEEDASVWFLRPDPWNQHALQHQSYTGGILGSEAQELAGYRRTPGFTSMNKHPVAIFGAYNSQRIVAQRGVFTLFGQDTQPLDNVYSTSGFSKDCLFKIIIPRRFLARLKKAVFDYGITESVIFPDLDGLARELKRHFGFEG